MSQSTAIVSVAQLVEVLKTVEAGTFAHVHYRTLVRMNKRNNPYFEKVYKDYKGNIYVGGDYQSRIENNLKKEGKDASNVQVQENRVGVHVGKVVLYNENTKKNYLQYEWFKEIKPQVHYLCDNDRIERELFQSFEVKKSTASSTQADLERKINIQSLTVDNIITITIDGVKYVNEVNAEVAV